MEIQSTIAEFKKEIKKYLKNVALLVEKQDDESYISRIEYDMYYSGPTAILILAIRERNFNRAGTETRPYTP